MRKKVIQRLFFGIVFTSILLMFNCTTEDDSLKNQPPVAPSDPTPVNDSENISVLTDLSWSDCTDPEGDSITYSIYFGTSNPPLLVQTHLLTNTFTPDTLKADTKYYWKVVAVDNKKNETSSALWNFTTQPPGDLNVLVCNSTQTIYYGSAEVFLYKTFDALSNDTKRLKYYHKAITDISDPKLSGAKFNNLACQTYYIFARYDTGGGKFIIGFTQLNLQSGKCTTLIATIL
jgi:hypothetical protein